MIKKRMKTQNRINQSKSIHKNLNRKAKVEKRISKNKVNNLNLNNRKKTKVVQIGLKICN